MNKVYECTKCGWQGTCEQKVDIMQPDGMGLLTCPSCGCGEFYVEPTVKNCTIPDVMQSVCRCINWHPPIKADEGKKAVCSYCKRPRHTVA